MNEEIKKKIVEWIFNNHQHHDGHTPCGDDECGGGCVDNDYPYVNSIELEKFIKSL